MCKTVRRASGGSKYPQGRCDGRRKITSEEKKGRVANIAQPANETITQANWWSSGVAHRNKAAFSMCLSKDIEKKEVTTESCGQQQGW